MYYEYELHDNQSLNNPITIGTIQDCKELAQHIVNHSLWFWSKIDNTKIIFGDIKISDESIRFTIKTIESEI